MGLFTKTTDTETTSDLTVNENWMREKKQYRFYLEVIGGIKPEQKYVVKASRIEIGNGMYKFIDENNDVIAFYPIERTIVKSIEEIA